MRAEVVLLTLDLQRGWSCGEGKGERWGEVTGSLVQSDFSGAGMMGAESQEGCARRAAQQSPRLPAPHPITRGADLVQHALAGLELLFPAPVLPVRWMFEGGEHHSSGQDGSGSKGHCAAWVRPSDGRQRIMLSAPAQCPCAVPLRSTPAHRPADRCRPVLDH